MDRLRTLLEINHGSLRQIRSMEGMRGLAVFLVFLVHYTTLVSPWLTAGGTVAATATRLHAMGNVGVDLFFVLSGYLIYGTLIEKPRSLVRYFRRRVERIYPTFLVVFVVYLVLSLLLPRQSKIPTDSLLGAAEYLVANLLLLPGLLPIEPMITVAWSLSYEMFYYLVVPLILGGLGLRRWPRRWRVLAFGLASLAGLGYALAYGGVHIRLVMFVSGILLFEAMDSEALPRIDLLGLLALLVGLAVIDRLAGGPLRYAVLFGAFFLLCHATFYGNARAHRLFCWTPLRWLGNMSYSFYLIHGLVLKAAFLVLARASAPAGDWGPVAFWTWLPVMFLLTLPPAGVLFALVEKPFSLPAKAAPARLDAVKAS